MKINGEMRIAIPNATTDHGIGGGGGTTEYSSGAGDRVTGGGDVAAISAFIRSNEKEISHGRVSWQTR
jgi:hypothetical protein